MSVFYHPITVLSASGEETAEVDALADTGSTYLWLPRPFLERLGHRPVASRRMIIATGGEIERGVAPVVVRLNGEAWAVPCVFGDEGSTPLLGAMVLEAFSLAADPVNHRLIPVPSLAMGAS